MSLQRKLAPVKGRYDELASLLSAGNLGGEKFVALSKEYAELEPVVAVLAEYEKALAGFADAEAMQSDPEMAELARDEYYALKEQIPALEEKIKLALIPKDAADAKNAILEIRAGTGGQEAALFAADLFAMYRGFAQAQGWRLEVVEMSESDLGGYKEVIAEINGVGVFAKLKFESGVHRVQRVPVTETQGRVHTSAATVAILPEAEEVDMRIDAKDLRIDTYRASGAGGQHVNRTDSAVRITHIPTGTVVAMQEERSQHKNRDKAMKILRSRIYESERQKLHDARSSDRKSQVGSGDRSERIRTYNYPQSRVTDHRINLTIYNLPELMKGPPLLEIVDQLIAHDTADKLAALEF